MTTAQEKARREKRSELEKAQTSLKLHQNALDKMPDKHARELAKKKAEVDKAQARYSALLAEELDR